MPDPQGRLTPADITALNAWYTKHNPVCPIDGPSTWGYLEYVLLTNSWGSVIGGVGPGNRVFAHIVLRCQSCGYEMFLDAGSVGVVIYDAGEGQSG